MHSPFLFWKPFEIPNCVPEDCTAVSEELQLTNLLPQPPPSARLLITCISIIHGILNFHSFSLAIFLQKNYRTAISPLNCIYIDTIHGNLYSKSFRLTSIHDPSRLFPAFPPCSLAADAHENFFGHHHREYLQWLFPISWWWEEKGSGSGKQHEFPCVHNDAFRRNRALMMKIPTVLQPSGILPSSFSMLFCFLDSVASA